MEFVVTQQEDSQPEKNKDEMCHYSAKKATLGGKWRGRGGKINAQLLAQPLNCFRLQIRHAYDFYLKLRHIYSFLHLHIFLLFSSFDGCEGVNKLQMLR